MGARAVYILIFYGGAWIVSRLARHIAVGVIQPGPLTPAGRRARPERQQTIGAVVSSAISLVDFGAATIATAGRFVRADTLVWRVGLFSAAFGLSPLPLSAELPAPPALTGRMSRRSPPARDEATRLGRTRAGHSSVNTSCSSYSLSSGQPHTVRYASAFDRMAARTCCRYRNRARSQVEERTRPARLRQVDARKRFAWDCRLVGRRMGLSEATRAPRGVLPDRVLHRRLTPIVPPKIVLARPAPR